MSDMPVRETAVYAALALAGHYFPRAADGDSRGAAPFDQAAFLLSGKYQAWDRWQELSHEEKQRIALVCSIAPAELANVRKFSVAARSLLAQLGADESGDAPAMAPFEIAGDSPFTADAAFGRLGGDPLGYVDRLTARFRRPSARPKPPEFAGPGTWLTGEIFVKNVGQVHGRLTIPAYPQFTEAPGHDSLPRVSTVPYLASLRIPTPELLGLAEKIDQRYPQDSRYLHRTLEQLFSVLQTTDTVTPAEALTLAAGGMEIFNAPTGTGKSVLVRVMAAWFAARSLRVAIVLPDIKACLAMTWNVRGDLAHLHSSGGIAHEPACAHLMSASSMHDRAVKLASLISEAPDAPGEWGERAERDVDPLAYGCAQKTFLEATGDYPPSREPCFSLRQQGTGSVACPWIPTCGKYAPVYEAAAASVVIMNHYMFMQGNLRIGVNLDGRPVHGMTAAELALRTCHSVLIDEVDQFQSRAIDKCASEVVLHSRRHWSAAPQEMDTDAKRLHIDDEHDLLPAVSHVRLMAEFLLLSICMNALSLHALEDERAAERVPDQTSTRWHLARGRDLVLLRLLWPDADAEDGGIPAGLFQRLNALMPGRYQRRDPLSGKANLPEPDWPEVRQALGALVAPRGEHLLDQVKIELHDILEDSIKNPHRRAQAINLLVTRTAMIELDEALAELQKKAHDYRSSGLRSAQKIAESLQATAISAALPVGMLDHAITGYRVTGLDDREKNAALAAQTIAGDPHTFTAGLGGIVSLTLAGTERPVMGLSATAFDDPWENEQGGRYALSRTALTLKTLPNISAPVLLLDSRVTRISASLVFSSTALAEQPGKDRPLLEVALNGHSGVRTVNRLALQALGRLEMDYSILRIIDERSKREQKLLADAKETKKLAAFPREHPGQVWPVLPKNYSFPIGTGPGMHHLRLLHQHFTKVFAGQAEPLEMREVDMSLPHRPTDPENISKEEYQRRKAESDRRKAERKQNPELEKPGPIKPRGSAFPEPESIVASVEAEGFKKLRIACLWYRDETRLRMLDTFRKTFGLAPRGLDPRDGEEFSLHGEQITAVFHYAAGFLMPGTSGNRKEALTASGAALRSQDGVLVGAWCETEIPAAPEAGDDSQTNLDDLDAKPQTKSILAGMDVPTQYLWGRDDTGVIKPKAKDHPAEMALLDLYRSLGIIDDRIANALQPEKVGYPVDRIAHVGIHVRQQNRRKGERGEPKVVITASALVPPDAAGRTWTMLGWSSIRPGWRPYRLAQTAFHASAYPEGTGDKKTYRQRWDDAAEAVELALTGPGRGTGRDPVRRHRGRAVLPADVGRATEHPAGRLARERQEPVLAARQHPGHRRAPPRHHPRQHRRR